MRFAAPLANPVARSAVVPLRTAQESMIIDNSLPEILAVRAEQVGIALALFRAAVLDETAWEVILPLSDQGFRMALVNPVALKRGIGVIRIHFECSDCIHPVVQRIICFLELLREQSQNPHP